MPGRYLGKLPTGSIWGNINSYANLTTCFQVMTYLGCIAYALRDVLSEGNGLGNTNVKTTLAYA